MFQSNFGASEQVSQILKIYHYITIKTYEDITLCIALLVVTLRYLNYNGYLKSKYASDFLVICKTYPVYVI